MRGWEWLGLLGLACTLGPGTGEDRDRDGFVAEVDSPFAVQGSLLSVRALSDLTLRWADIRDNEVLSDNINGGLIAMAFARFSMTNAIVAGNTVGRPTASHVRGGFLWAANPFGEPIVLENVDVVSNTTLASSPSELVGGVVWVEPVYGPLSPLRVINTSFVDNSANGGSSSLFEPGAGGCNWSYTNVHQTAGGASALPACAGGPGNLDVAAGYTDTTSLDPLNWSLELAVGSSLVDAGDPGLVDADGSRSDIGAYGGPAGDDW
ncbi:MAG: hypothetical protein AAF602_26345 [Myxococcota bacterium]